MRNPRLATLAAMAMLASASYVATNAQGQRVEDPVPARPPRRPSDPLRRLPHQTEEVAVWNAAVDAKKAAKRAARRGR